MKAIVSFLKLLGRLLKALGLLIKSNWTDSVSYLGALGVVIGGCMVALPPLFTDPPAEGEKQPDVGWAVGIIILGVLVSAAGAIGQGVAMHRLRRRLRDVTLLARTDEAVAMRSVLHRNLERLEELRGVSSSTTSQSKILAAYKPLVTGVLGKLQAYFERDGVPVRVNYYRLTMRDDKYVLEVVDKTFEVRRSVITGEKPEDREILIRTLRGEGEYREDMETPDGGQDPEPAYRCFATVPAMVDGKIHGMLSMNTTAPKGLPERLAMEYLEVFGLILAVAESCLGMSVPHAKGDDPGMSALDSTVSAH